MMTNRTSGIAPALLLLAPLVAGGEEPRLPLPLEARHVEHLLSRAGFGAPRREIEEGLALGLEALVDRLLERRHEGDSFFYERMALDEPLPPSEMEREERQQKIREMRRADGIQMREFGGWWIERMIAGEDPLLDRLTLFWHGFFTSSYTDVKRSDELIAQNELFRRHALDSYADLLHGIVRDAAMLRYLDNDTNRRRAPNENLARELLELFSLGEGNYSEDDVKEAARALTGRRVDREGDYDFRGRDHDRGEKTILGDTGRHDGDDLVRIILAQEACPRWVAGRLIEYFEGSAPEESRLLGYAALLRESDFAMRPFLRRLFLDPAFYREEVMGARVMSPLDYLVGICRRLEIQPPSFFVEEAAAVLGQRLFEPPSVKGWDEGEAWITTSSMLQRGNFAGMLLGVLSLEEVLADVQREIAARAREGGGEAMKPADRVRDARPEFARNLQALQRVGPAGWRPRIHLMDRCRRAGATTDAEIVEFLLEELLVGDARASTRQSLREFLATERVRLGLGAGPLPGPEGEHLLRRLAHLILSLPEAQLS